MMNVNVNFGDIATSVAEAHAQIKALQEYKRAKLYLSVPRGRANAKSAKAILGEAYQCLSSMPFRYYGPHREMITFMINGEDVRIYREMHNYNVTYANVDNPSDTMTVAKKCYIYWTE